MALTLTQALRNYARSHGLPLPPPPKPFRSSEEASSALYCRRYLADADYRHATVCRWEATPAAILNNKAN